MTAPPGGNVPASHDRGCVRTYGLPEVPQWPQRKPWLMTSPAQFRPGPPPALTSEPWARDYNEIKALGGKSSTRRSPSRPRSPSSGNHAAPDLPRSRALGRQRSRAGGHAERTLVRGGHSGDGRRTDRDDRRQVPLRLLAAGHRDPQGDIDGNNATERETSWTPFIDTPMHPEYPCAHCIVAGAVGAVLQAEIGTGPMPTLQTTRPPAKGAARSWTRSTTSCRKWRMRASTTACTTATPRKSVRRWGNRSASWPRRSTCGRPVGCPSVEGGLS